MHRREGARSKRPAIANVIASMLATAAAVALAVCLVAARPGSQTIAGIASIAASHPHPAPVVRIAGDFDGDGIRDLVLGAPGRDAVALRLSRSGRIEYLHPSAGTADHARFGAALAVGDFNGDGYPDLAVGAPGFRRAPHTPASGAVFEFDGTPSGLQSGSLRVTGPDDGSSAFDLGSSLAAADIDGDGRTDLAAGMTRDAETWIVRGTASGLDGSSPQVLTDTVPAALAFADVNGDHRADLLLGAPHYPAADGSLCAYLAGANGRLRAVPDCIPGRSLGVHRGLGSALAAGDVNGDGRPDIVVGAAADVDGQGVPTGSIAVLFGGTGALSTWRHERILEGQLNPQADVADAFGASLAVARIDPDGFADVVAGAPGAGVDGVPYAGAVYVLSGSAHGPTADTAQRIDQATGQVPGRPVEQVRFGAVVYAGPFGGAPTADVVVGVPNGTDGAPEGGLVVEVPGGPDGLRADAASAIYGVTAHGRLGRAIA